jgi:hypothetical protein
MNFHRPAGREELLERKRLPTLRADGSDHMVLDEKDDRDRASGRVAEPDGSSNLPASVACGRVGTRWLSI